MSPRPSKAWLPSEVGMINLAGSGKLATGASEFGTLSQSARAEAGLTGDAVATSTMTFLPKIFEEKKTKKIS